MQQAKLHAGLLLIFTSRREEEGQETMGLRLGRVVPAEAERRQRAAGSFENASAFAQGAEKPHRSECYPQNHTAPI
jgi:hypothetical protein